MFEVLTNKLLRSLDLISEGLRQLKEPFAWGGRATFSLVNENSKQPLSLDMAIPRNGRDDPLQFGDLVGLIWI